MNVRPKTLDVKTIKRFENQFTSRWFIEPVRDVSKDMSLIFRRLQKRLKINDLYWLPKYESVFKTIGINVARDTSWFKKTNDEGCLKWHVDAMATDWQYLAAWPTSTEVYLKKAFSNSNFLACSISPREKVNYSYVYKLKRGWLYKIGIDVVHRSDQSSVGRSRLVSRGNI